MEIRGKVHYVHAHVDEFEDSCEQLIESIGDEHVVRLILTPSTYRHPSKEDELRGFTLLLLPDTPVSSTYLRNTLGTGTSEYELSTMADGSEITVERLHSRECSIAFNSCVRDCSEAHFRLFEKNAAWEPVLGTDCVDEICVVREYQHTSRRFHWRLFVTAGLQYAADELLDCAVEEEWNIQTLYRSSEYSRLMRAASINRNRIAYAAAHSLGLAMSSSMREQALTPDPVDYCRPAFSSLHHTLVEKQLEDKLLVYAVHVDTFPLHAYHRIPIRVPSLQMITVLEPDGEAGRASWKNAYANSFPSSCGMKRFEDLLGVMSGWDPSSAYGNGHCSKHWGSMVPYNLYNIDEAYKPWDRLQPGLQQMGLNNHWRQRAMEVVMIKSASMDEERLTAFELLRTVDAEGFIRVPIHCQVFRGGSDYKGLWHVYELTDPPPAELLKRYTVPGYVYLHESYVRRVAYYNDEVSELYTQEEAEDGYTSSSSSGSDGGGEELDFDDAFE